MERVRSEARAGLYKADVFNAVMRWVTAGPSKDGFLKRIDNLPAIKDAADPDIWFISPVVTPDVLNHPYWNRIVSNYTVSTKVIPPDREPKSWDDLKDPWWKGKICMFDPLSSGGEYQVLWKVFRALGYPDWWVDTFYDVFRKENGKIFTYLVGAANPIITGDCGLWPWWSGISVAEIKSNHTVDKATWLKGGSWDPVQPVGPANINANGVLAKAPHPNAALLLVNWLYSKEGLESRLKWQGVDEAMRKDIPSPVEEQYWPEASKRAKVAYYAEPEWWNFEEYSFQRKTLLKLTNQGGVSKDAFVKDLKETSMTFWGQWPPPPIKTFPVD